MEGGGAVAKAPFRAAAVHGVFLEFKRADVAEGDGGKRGSFVAYGSTRVQLAGVIWISFYTDLRLRYAS